MSPNVDLDCLKAWPDRLSQIVDPAARIRALTRGEKPRLGAANRCKGGLAVDGIAAGVFRHRGLALFPPGLTGRHPLFPADP